jgi:hypothetical protein
MLIYELYMLFIIFIKNFMIQIFDQGIQFRSTLISRFFYNHENREIKYD